MFAAVIRFARRRPRSRKIARRSAAPAVSEAKQTDAAAVSRISTVAPPTHLRRRPPVAQKKNPSKRRARIAEVAGGTTAECAAICCCCPCGLINILVLAAVRLPAGLCHRALRRRILLHRAKKRAALLGSGSSDNSNSNSKAEWSTTEDEELTKLTGARVVMVVGDPWPARSPTAELSQLEKEVWSKFYRSGFWRTPSQRELQTASELN